MRKMKLLFALLVLASIQITTNAQNDATAVRKELESSYASMARALKEKDLQTLMSHLADDYTQKGLTGKIKNRRQVESDLRQTMDSLETLNATYRIVTIVVGKNEAIANIHYGFSGVTKTDVDPAGESLSVEFISPMRAVWTKTERGWRLKRMEELKGGMLKLNGKPSKPPGN
jgi:ketosteroid isomerase-like protein